MSKYEIDVWEYADEFKNLDTNETFGGYAVCELLEQKDQQIAELQKQLERHNKYFNSFSCDNFDEFTDFISTFMLTPHEEQTLIKDLKKQLEEKEKDNQNYKKSNEAYNQLLEECIKELIGE